MFRQLRLKMTLINAGVTILLFVILISSVTALLSYNSTATTNFFLKKIGQAVIEHNMQDLPPRHDDSEEKDPPPGIFPMPRANFFFIQLDSMGTIVHKSSYATVSDDRLAKLALKIYRADTDRGDMPFAKSSFAYLRLPMNNGQTLIVLNDLADESELLHNITYNLIIVAIFCTILSFLASFFMAKHAIRPIQYATEKQKQFVSNASHELRTPITIIQANLDILNGSPPEDTIADNQKWLENIQDETTRMTELINALLFLARADANQQLLEKEYFSLNDLCKKSLEAFELLAAEKEIHLKFSSPIRIKGLGDPARIQQLLTILIDNAMHHTLSGGQITVSCKMASDASIFEVKDTGDGISAEDLPHIFDRFYQSDSSRNQSGAGLGLSMAKWIVEQHKGTITVASTVGEGAAFTVTLPNN